MSVQRDAAFIRPAAIIFDMDGLLLDSERIALQAFTDTCREFGLGDETVLFMRCVGTNTALGAQVLRDGLADRADAEAFNRAWDARYVEATRERPIPLKAGVNEMLDHIAARQLSTAVATSTSTARRHAKTA